MFCIGDGENDTTGCDRDIGASSNVDKKPTPTTPTTTTSTVSTTVSDPHVSVRCSDMNVRRWLHTAMPHSAMQTRSADVRSRSQRPITNSLSLLNHRPPSTVLDAIRAIEARQLPPLSQVPADAVAATTLNAEYHQRPASSTAVRRSGCRLIDIVRRRVDPAICSRVMRKNAALFQQCQGRRCDLGQGQLEGLFEAAYRMWWVILLSLLFSALTYTSIIVD